MLKDFQQEFTIFSKFKNCEFCKILFKRMRKTKKIENYYQGKAFFEGERCEVVKILQNDLEKNENMKPMEIRFGGDVKGFWDTS